ncbi:neuropeptide F receptor isoform X1 [Octopus bimaculoides]|nr:neuropeptide F receptor isoform X1 [Octopus bimaculoides]XP_052831446.1 neuropeptide F receptor isoform X1 [Octopus bimaculoides]XP_052831453.1 neuropeptide F receptor isoform X1 [Octopus bimaculoides]
MTSSATITTERIFNQTMKVPFHFSINDAKTILQQEAESKWFTPTAEMFFIFSYSVLICFGSVGNALVCYIVMRSPGMRTARNMFIFNLAISDLSLCLFTQSLNLYRTLNNQWKLGAFMCKFGSLFQGINIFVSTSSIMAIALYRFQVIVHPTISGVRWRLRVTVALVAIWVVSFLLASPLLVFTIHKSSQPIEQVDIYLYHCIEDVRLRLEKGAYSVASLIFQYLGPGIIVILAHTKIFSKLNYRIVNRSQMTPALHNTCGYKSQERKAKRKRKTKILLTTIAVVFALSWLPLNVFNILIDFKGSAFIHKNIDVNLTFGICHLLVLSSACTNPVLYGWLNENFRREFFSILSCCICASNLRKRLRSLRATTRVDDDHEIAVYQQSDYPGEQSNPKDRYLHKSLPVEIGTPATYQVTASVAIKIVLHK